MAKKPDNPDEAALRDLALSLPETTEDFPWGHRAMKVKKKVFVFMGTGQEAGADHDDFFITVKLPISGAVALSIKGVEPTGYGLGKSGWVSARFPPKKAPVPMLKEWIVESYCAVAPKTLAAKVQGATPAPKAKAKAAKKAKAGERAPKAKAAKKTKAAERAPKANAAKKAKAAERAPKANAAKKTPRRG